MRGLAQLVLLLYIYSTDCCSWPAVDALFIVDSTQYTTSFQHLTQLQFFRKVLSNMNFDGEGSRVAVAQFTPSSRFEYSLLNSSTSLSTRIEAIPYSPCNQMEQCPGTSVNRIAQNSLVNGNRKMIPDVIIVVSNSYNPLPEVLENEPLMSPISPLHVFYVVVGSQMIVSRFEPSAYTIPLKVNEFTQLAQLVEPVCESVNGYLNGGSSTKFGYLCWIPIVIILVVALVLLLFMLYAIYSYRDENRRLRYRVLDTEKTLRTQNEYFTAKLHEQMEQQIKSGEKHAEDIKKQQELLLQTQVDRQMNAIPPLNHAQPQPIAVPVYFTNNPADFNAANHNQQRSHDDHHEHGNQVHGERRDSKEDKSEQQVIAGTESSAWKEHQNGAPSKHKESGDEKGDNADWHSEDPSSISEEVDRDEADELAHLRPSHLPADHPARTLPPIDLMFLFDTSSSIGINNFEILKSCVCTVLKDVDIAPGRSRVALLQYAQDPSVVFGFDRYYSYESVKKGVLRLSYTGGATMLSKALAFAGGIMYKEQNMKTQHRRHKFLPTPRHDRLQVLCLVSDGYSDDSADKESVVLHEKLHVKVFAIVTKSFNKDKLVPITRFEGSIFTVHQKESISIWLWRQQKNWAENYGAYVEREKALIAKAQ